MSALRSRWAAIGAAVAVTLGGGGIGLVRATTTPAGASAFVPIDPCRLADTRPNTIGPDSSMTFDGWGSTGDCTLPTDITGLALNVTAVGATRQTNLRFHPTGTPVPGTANLNPTPGAPPTPNAVNATLDATTGKFDVFNRFGNVAVVIDVMGYYTDHDHDHDLSPIVIGQGIDWVTNGFNPSTVLISQDHAVIDGGGGGTAHLSLVGPTAITRTSYRLESVRYCIREDTGFVDEASIIGLGNNVPGDPDESGNETKVDTDRSSSGCYTITPDIDVALRPTHHLMLFIVDSVNISEVTATYVAS